MVEVRVLGISGTPIQDGNCDKLVQEALKVAGGLGDVETEFITLADKDIAMCKHCQYCVENRTKCKIEDDFHKVWGSIEKADGMILAGPTWYLTLSPPLLNLFSRMRYYTFFTNKLRNKVAGALTLGYFGTGMDHALATIQHFCIANNMIPVGGSGAIGSTVVYGKRADYLEHGVLDDAAALIRTRQVATRVVEISRMIKHSTEDGIVLPLEQRRTSLGARVE